MVADFIIAYVLMMLAALVVFIGWTCYRAARVFDYGGVIIACSDPSHGNCHIIRHRSKGLGDNLIDLKLEGGFLNVLDAWDEARKRGIVTKEAA